MRLPSLFTSLQATSCLQSVTVRAAYWKPCIVIGRGETEAGPELTLSTSAVGRLGARSLASSISRTRSACGCPPPAAAGEARGLDGWNIVAATGGGCDEEEASPHVNPEVNHGISLVPRRPQYCGDGCGD